MSFDVSVDTQCGWLHSQRQHDTGDIHNDSGDTNAG